MKDRKPSRRRIAWLFVIATILGLLLWQCPQREASQRSPQETRQLEDSKDSKPFESSIKARTSHAANDPGNPIAELSWFPQEPCAGQSVKVDVRLKPSTKDHQVFVQGAAGTSTSVRVAGESSMNLPVLVRAPDGQAHTSIHTIPIKRCEADVPRIRVVSESLPDEEDTYTFRVRTLSGLETIARYQWEFGDGNKKTTTSPFAKHSYKFRKQEDDISSFVIQVTAVDERGKQAIDYTTVSLPNTHFMVYQRGKLVLPAELSISKEGKLHASAFNFSPEDIDIHNAKLELISCKKNQDTHSSTSPSTQFVAPEKLHVAPGEHWSTVLRYELDQVSKSITPLCNFRLLLTGESEARDEQPSLPVEIRLLHEFGVREDTGSPIGDRQREIETFKASILLGKEKVTQAEIEQLKAEGKI